MKVAAKNTALGAIFSVLLVLFPISAFSQSNVDGYVYGDAPAGSEIKLNSVDTGFARTLKASADGSFRFPVVPSGRYRITYTDAAGKSYAQEVVVSVGEGRFVSFVASDATQLDTIVATGSNISPVDMLQTESVTTITAERITNMPIVRDVQAVALLAPGTIEGDNRFTSQSGRPLISFGGSSPGENTFYVNGMNITDFRNFLGSASVPFQFFREFQIRTGGYSAEFGRSLGGVVNAVTKRGTNDFTLAANMYYEPDALRTDQPSDKLNGSYRIDNRSDAVDDFQTNIEVGGPILRDRLYGYGFINLRKNDTEGAAGTARFAEISDNDPFYGAKLDFEILPGHSLEYTGFVSETTTDTDISFYDADTGTDVGALNTLSKKEDGGQVHILRYLGSLTDTLSLSVLAGQMTRTESAASVSAITGNPCPVVIDRRTGVSIPIGCWDASGTGQTSDTEDTRDAFRFDLSWILGNHTLRGGVDYEKNTSDTLVSYEGGVAYRYITDANSSTGEAVRVRYYAVDGEFEEKLTALYIEDNWQATDRLMLSLGLRNETLENFNKNGEEFLDFDAQITPRLGMTYDLTGEGRHKLFANVGRYTMPIATNTNIRFAGGEFFTEQFFELNGVNPDDTPQIGAQMTALSTLSDGTVPDPKATVDANIDPMYQDEAMVGIESAITDKTVLGIKYIDRRLVRAVEDSSFVDANNNFSYFLFNPGQSVTLYADTDNDGVAEQLYYSPSDLAMPDARRKYRAVEFTVDHSFSRDFQGGASYTWSHSYGNFEGVFQSDVGQDDAGITIAFDTPGLAWHSSGNLPNDRRHKTKVYGNWNVAQDWTVAGNLAAYSGRPRNKLGNCPAGVDSYPVDCFFFQGEPSPRGSAGETDWIFNFDVGLRYKPSMLQNKLTAGIDVFNVFNWHEPTRVVDVGEELDNPAVGGVSQGPGSPADDYGAPAAYQSPRRVRFSLQYKFW